MRAPPAVLQRLTNKSLLIFDFDGTLADTSPLHAQAFAQVLEPLGVAVDYPSIAGMRTVEAMRKCLSDAGRLASDATLAELGAAKQRVVRALMASTLTAMPGADAFLGWARSRFQMAMVTSGSRGTVVPALRKLGWVFDPLICGDDVRHAKPNPEGFLAALRLAGVAASRAIVFEDSAAGLAAARSAGIDAEEICAQSWVELMEGLA